MKRFLLIALVFVTLLVAGLGVWLASIDVNQFKPRIVTTVMEATGRDFDIAGDLALRPSLIPTLSVEGVRFGNADWAAHETMATADRFELVVDLLPLLSREISVRRVVLRGVRLVLETDRKGRGNWVLPLAEADAGERPPGELPGFDLAEILIEDATIEYRAYESDALVLELTRLILDTRDATRSINLELDARINETPVAVRGTLAPLARLVRNEPYDVDLNLSVGDARLRMTGAVAEPLQVRGVDVALEGDVADATALSTLTGGAWPAGAALALRGRLQTDDGETIRVQDLELLSGASDVTGSALLKRDDDRPSLALELSSKVLDLAAFSDDGEEQASKSERVFTTDPLALDGLRSLDLDLRLAIGQLLSRTMKLETVRSQVSVKNGRLQIEAFDAVLEGGTLNGSLDLDAARDPARLSHALRLKGVALAPLLNGSEGGSARGGTGNLDLSISGRGRSMAEIMGSADGHFRLDAAGLELANDTAALAAADVFVKALDILNPLSASSDTTLIECAVFNFPIRAGTMESKTGLGVRTRQLSILGGGTIDLKTEKLDLGVNPKPREGIGLNAASLSEFVRLGGTLSNPQPAADVKGVASAGLKVGAAIATGGLSLVAEGLFDRAGGGVDACAVARGEQQLTAGGETPAEEPSMLKQAGEKTGDALKSAGDTVKGVFKGLFGD